MVDKISGLEVGVHLTHEGQGVPDLGQMELKICKASAGDYDQPLGPDLRDSQAVNILDVNGCKEPLVSSLGDVEKNRLPRLEKKV
jgi:hypothetical protein